MDRDRFDPSSAVPAPEAGAQQHDLDRALHAQWARLTTGLSPAALAAAYLDWATHLAFSPTKQLELATKAARKSLRLALHAAQSVQSLRAGGKPCGPCIEPLPQDRRFVAPEWQQPPFDLVYQGFLLTQQWWHVATSGVRGVTPHHEQVVNFGARQWLDLFSPSNFVLTNPELLARTVKSGGANLWQGLQHAIEDAARLAANQPPVGTERFRPGFEVAVTPGQVVFRNHLIELIQYAPQTPEVFARPLLLVPAWIMKYYILDLSPANSLVRHLVGLGHTVFVISWRNPGAEDHDLGMEDYLDQGLLAALHAVQQIVPRQPVQIAGYCLGGTLAAIAAAALVRDGEARLQSLTLLAAQVDFSEPGELALFIDESQVAYLEDLMAAQGYLDGKQMAGAFALLNSRDLVFSRVVRDYLMGQRAPFTDLQAWNADATRMPLRQHSEYLRGMFLNNDLAAGRWRVHGAPVALQDIRVPVFALGTARDTVSPWRSVYKINLLADTEVTFCLTSGGHNVGVVNPPGPGVPRNYRLAMRAADARFIDPETWAATAPAHDGSWWPAWTAWLERHAGKRVAPPSMGNAAAGLPPLYAAPGQHVAMP